MPATRKQLMSAGSDPINAQRYATQRPYSPEDLAQPLFDRINYPAAGATELRCFTQPLGSVVTLNQAGVALATKTKSYRDTNMDNAGVVPTKRYTFTGVTINYIPLQQAPAAANTVSIADDIIRLMNGGYVEFRIVDKPLLYVPLNLIPSSNPINSISTTQNASTVMGTGALAAIPYPMFKFAIPITLNPYENFSFILRFDGVVTVSQSTDIQVVLSAFMRRPS